MQIEPYTASDNHLEGSEFGRGRVRVEEINARRLSEAMCHEMSLVADHVAPVIQIVCEIHFPLITTYPRLLSSWGHEVQFYTFGRPREATASQCSAKF